MTRQATQPPAGASPPQQTLLEYQAILENASVGILFTRDRKVQHCNPRLSEICGWPHGELIGQPGSVFYLTPEDYAEIGRIGAPLLASGQLLEREMPMRRKDGSVVHCLLRAKAIDPRNTAAGTIWIVEDISERKRASEQLQDLLLKQQAILDNASVGILFTRDGLIVHSNPRMEAILGWPAGTLTGNKTTVFFKDHADYLRFGVTVGPILATGELVDVEWENIRRDGSRLWCRHLAKALPSSDGSHSAIWITEDITDKKATQEALADAHRQLELRVQERTAELLMVNQQLEAIIRSSPLAIYTRDLQNRVTAWNAAAEAIFGWRADQIIGHPVPTMPEEDKKEADRFAAHIRQGETLINKEAVRQRRDGSLVVINHTVAPLLDGEGRLYGNLTIASDITERRAAEQRIQFLAYHDALTGLPNRLLLQDRFDQAVANAERNGTRVALMFMDLDNFKQINDALGHATGDALLKEVTTRLRECVRDTDTISRQGGDEFVVVLRDLPDDHAAVPIVAKIMGRMQEPIVVDGNELSTSASMGVTLYPDDGQDFETLLKKADMAMYKAKESGRNNHQFFNEDMGHQAHDHLILRTGLRRALDQGELTLHYQPQFCLGTHRLVGAEALLRWNHPELGPIEPGRFIPVAEESGLIVPIGEWVIRKACHQASRWRAEGFPDLVVAVNLSAAQFKRGGIERTVTQALEDSGLPPSGLELELTESILIQNVEQVLATVKRLKLLGVRLSIDDFGTGYSSLSYLKRFAIDKLKIDQSFVRDLASDPDDAAIVHAIIQMAHSLNLRTIAEGVESEAILNILREFGCDEAQGYLLGHPSSSADFPRLLNASTD